MQLIDRIEKRRFVGREFLLWLWFESEIFDATLETREHGSFGLWLERKLVLSLIKESTRITAPNPGLGPEAKAALRRGQLPQSAGLRITLKDTETSLALDAERLAVTGLKLNTVLDDADDEPPSELIEELTGTRRRPGGAQKEQLEDAEDEVFYERMRLTTEVESVIEALYRDFLELRLGPAWDKHIVPALQRFARGEAIDADAYRAALKPKAKKSARG
jgi:hypothetical protein